MKISIIGLGFVGFAMCESFNNKLKELDITNITIYGYDKYKNGGIGTLIDCINSNIIFTALPTLFNDQLKSYDNSPTLEVLTELQKYNYTGTIVIKSTVEPCFTEAISLKFPSMQFIHNPEFLTARTAYHDFHSQNHIVLGKSSNCNIENCEKVTLFYSKLYPLAKISQCTCTESECMKIFCNTFYSVKIQYFNELYLLSQKIGADYNEIVKLMLQNNWINPMHTNVPGPDGKLSYGGLCFPKDTNALLEFMKLQEIPSAVLNACITERNDMRKE